MVEFDWNSPTKGSTISIEVRPGDLNLLRWYILHSNLKDPNSKRKGGFMSERTAISCMLADFVDESIIPLVEFKGESKEKVKDGEFSLPLEPAEGKKEMDENG